MNAIDKIKLMLSGMDGTEAKRALECSEAVLVVQVKHTRGARARAALEAELGAVRDLMAST